MKLVLNPSCRLCDSCEESIYHLLDSCSGTLQYRRQNDISVDTLVYETPSSLLKISRFDTWLRDHLPFDSTPHDYRVRQGIDLVRKRKRADETESDGPEISLRSNFLLVPSKSNCVTSVVASSKVLRIE